MAVVGMNINTKEIISEFNQRKMKFRSDNSIRKELQAYISSRIAEEIEEIEASSSACTLEDTKKYQESIGSVSAVKLGDEVHSRFASPEMMRIMACQLNAIFYTLPGEPGYADASEKVKEWITGMRTFGNESVSGVAMTGGLEGTQDMFVVKVAQKVKSTDLIHEAFVGMARVRNGIGGLNYLRRFIPNFAFIYGAFYCSPPVIDPETKAVLDICSKESESTVPYTIYEQVFPSVTAQRYMAGSTVNSFLSMYMQVVIATFFAHSYNEYTHYDLHNQNVLMRNVSEKPFQIRYQFNDENIYISATDVATIIDYGMTHIKHDGKSYGTHDSGLYPFWILPNRSWPFHDIYKFTCFTMRDAVDLGNVQFVKILEKVIRYFNKTDSLEVILKEQYVDRYALPYNEYTKNFNMADFILYLFTTLQPFGIGEVVKTTRDESLPLLSCNGLTYEIENCETKNVIESELGLQKGKSFFAIYDEQLVETPYPMNSSIYTEESSKLHQKIEHEKQEVLKIIRTPTQLQNINLDSMSLADVQTMQFLKRQFTTLLKVVSITERLNLYVQVGNYIAGLYQDYNMMERMKTIEDLINSYSPAICEVNENAQENYAKIYAFVSTDMYRQLVSKDDRFYWYQTGAGNIVSLSNRGCMLHIRESTKRISSHSNVTEDDAEMMSYTGSKSENTKPSLRSTSPVRSLM